MSKIIVVGSLHYDIMLTAPHRPEKGETVMGTACRYKFGGKGGNQAISAAHAGADVIFVGAVGNDEQGCFLIDTLRNQDINVDFIDVNPTYPSGMSVAITDADGDYGAVVVSNANQHIPSDVLLNDALWNDACLLILQNEVAESINVRAAIEARRRGIKVIINAAPARILSTDLEKNIDLLLVNAVEARDMCGVCVDDLLSAKQAAYALARNFPQVVVTAGEHGVAWCSMNSEAEGVPAKKVTLVSTHGAGDCFTGVLSTALSQKYSLSEAVVLATDAAAKHVSRTH